MKLKENFFKILSGMSIGIVIALMPQAMLGEIANALKLTEVSSYLVMMTSLMGMMIGIGIAHQYKLTPISTSALAVSTLIAGRAIRIVEGAIVLKGTGDVINAAIGATIALVIILNLQNRLKAYNLIILPALCIVIVGLITSRTYGPVSQVTDYIGKMIELFTTLQPLLMAVLIAISFGILIVSPISTVGVALLINLSGIGSAAANVGVASVALSLAILSYPKNGLATSLAHFIGSPKIQMANFIKAPIMILPGLVASMISGIFVVVFNAQGTPLSAGFGLSGLIGPLGHLNSVGFSLGNIIVASIVFIIIPVVSSFVSVYIIRNVLHLVHDEQYALTIA